MVADSLFKVVRDKGYDCFEAINGGKKDKPAESLEEGKAYYFIFRDGPEPRASRMVNVPVVYRDPGIAEECYPPDIIVHVASFSVKGQIVTLYLGAAPMQIPLPVLVRAINDQFDAYPKA